MLRVQLQFFAKEGPGGEKTEPATAKKLDDARKEGQVAKSKEIGAGLGLAALFYSLKFLSGYIGNGLISIFRFTYTRMPDWASEGAKSFTPQLNGYLLRLYLIEMLKIILPIFLIGFVVAFLADFLQVKWKFTMKPLQPKFEKMNPLKGLKRIISKDSLFELIKAIVKVVIITIIVYNAIKGELYQLFTLYDMPLFQAVKDVGMIAIDVGIRISIIYLLIAAVDYVYQRHKFNEEMKMTKQEVKDEMKNTEGSPEIKGRQRQRMRESSQRRMMQSLPQADVVITNPTHYAVALRYDADEMDAPVVIAKGVDYLAQKIKDTARENKIEVVENKPLARMLYANVEIGAKIPSELYQAVAEVLAYVYHKNNENN